MDDQKRDALRRACLHIANSRDRWRSRAVEGLSDDQLREVLSDEFGIMGGCSGPGILAVSYRGHPPRIWFGDISCNKNKSDLSGRALLKEVRNLFGIPYPNESQGLFTTMPAQHDKRRRK